MVTLATQPINPNGLDTTLTNASVGGDRFMPGRHVMLRLASTAGSPVTVTVPVTVPVIGLHVADDIITIPAGGSVIAGPFPAEFFADPADGLARVTYSDAAHTQIAAVGLRSTAYGRGTVVTEAIGAPADLPSGSMAVMASGHLYLTPSPGPVTRGTAVTSGSSTPSDLPAGSIYFKTASGVASDLYITGGESAAQLMVVNTAPSDLAPGQIAVLCDPSGTATDLYVGGIS